jgi:pimeloyl-ACP methyl ester carboxylesterase
MPVLLMQGEKTSRRLASIVDATHKCLPSGERATIPNAGHGMHLMNPAAFEKTLVQFLSK